MIRGIKLRKMLEAHLDQNVAAQRNQDRQAKNLRPYRTGVAGFNEELRESFGLTEDRRTGEPRLDPSIASCSPREFDFAEVSREFFGRDTSARQMRGIMEQGRQLNERMNGGSEELREAEGNVVLPSHFANISAFTDVVGGLIDALVLEAYQNPQYIGDELMTIREARVQGGKRIRPTNDGGVSDDGMVHGEAYPTVGLGETFVRIPENERNGVRIALNEAAVIYDRTGEIQSACEMAGESVRRKKEIRQADVVLGKKNTYSRDNLNSNTYRTATGKTAGASLEKAYNGTYPMTWSNWATSTPLNDWQDLNVAALTLGANTDPATGWEIAINPEEAVLLVQPHRYLHARSIIDAVTLQTRTTQPVATQATAVTLDVRNHGNMVANYAKKIMFSWIWFNRIGKAGTNASQSGNTNTDTNVTHILDATVLVANAAAKAQSVWLWGNFKKAFEYRQIIPFESFQAPLSAEEVARDIVAVWIAREWGVPWVLEPRYVFQAADTYTT